MSKDLNHCCIDHFLNASFTSLGFLEAFAGLRFSRDINTGVSRILGTSDRCFGER
jgi:hypothetical protein